MKILEDSLKRIDPSYFIASRLRLDSNQSFTNVIVKIAIGTVALSLAVMIISSAIMTGFKNQITEKVFGFWGHIHITDANISRTFELYPIEDDTVMRESIASIEGVQFRLEGQNDMQSTNGGVRHIQSYILAPAIIKTKDAFEGIMLKGIGSDYSEDLINEKLRAGNPLQFGEDSLSKDIMLSEQTANRLQLKIGDPLILNFVKDRNPIKKRFVVSAVYRSGLEEYDSKIAFIDQRVLQQVLKWNSNQIGGYEIILEDFDDAEIITNFIYEELIPANQYAETIKDKFPGIFEWLDLQDINERIILLLMIIVSIINMATSLIIFILERSKMIGVLKSIGMSDWGIRKVFLYNAFYIVGLGLFIGNAIGLIFCFLQEKFQFIKLDEANYYLSSAPIELQFWDILLINIGSMIIIFSFLIIPTYLITKIDPIKVLRFN